MSDESSYESECMRAELLGIDPPDRATWEAANADRLQREKEEIEIAQDEVFAEQGEQMQGASGKLDELNNILSLTQKKLNKFKTVCGSLTSLIKINSASGSTSNLNEQEPGNSKNDINEAIETLDAMKVADGETDVQVTKQSVRDIGHKVTRQLDALDSLINKSERAEAAMNHQNQQMKKHLNK